MLEQEHQVFVMKSGNEIYSGIRNKWCIFFIQICLTFTFGYFIGIWGICG